MYGAAEELAPSSPAPVIPATEPQWQQRISYVRVVTQVAVAGLAFFGFASVVFKSAGLSGADVTLLTGQDSESSQSSFTTTDATNAAGQAGASRATPGLESEPDPPPPTPTEENNLDVKNPAHIVFFLLDDAGWNDFGYNSVDIEGATPNIDSLATKGVLLKNYYSQPSCTPARASLLTGQYPISIGFQHECIQVRPCEYACEHGLLDGLRSGWLWVATAYSIGRILSQMPRCCESNPKHLWGMMPL